MQLAVDIAARIRRLATKASLGWAGTFCAAEGGMQGGARGREYLACANVPGRRGIGQLCQMLQRSCEDVVGI
jgi:hypothetical protein